MNMENQSTIKEQSKEVKIEFKKLSESKLNRGVKILSYGNYSTGKTHFALTSPGPVFIIDTENGASPLADKFPDAKVINICNMNNESIEEKDEVKNFEQFQETINYLMSLPDSEVGTIIIDSMSDIWEWTQAYGKVKIFKIGIEDRLKQQWDWGILNRLYLKNLKKLINKKCNVIIIAREGEIYESAGKPSGRFEPKCQKKTPYLVDVVLYHEVKFINKQYQFQCKIKKCRQKGEVIGNIIEKPSFDKINILINS